MFSTFALSQEIGQRFPTYPVTNIVQTGGGSGYWIVEGNVIDPAGQFDASDIDRDWETILYKNIK